MSRHIYSQSAYTTVSLRDHPVGTMGLLYHWWVRNLYPHSFLLPSNTTEQLKDFLINFCVDLLEYLFVVIRILFKDDYRMSENIHCLGPKAKPALFAKIF